MEDLTARIQLGAHQAVAAGLALGNEVQRNRLMSMRFLHRSRLHDAKHRPHRMGDGASLGKMDIAQQNTDPIPFGRLRSRHHLRQLLLHLYGWIM
ncbi:toll-like receptor 13-like protein, partial [Lasius niger]